MDESVRELIDGAYDLHIHTSPSHAKRRLDDVDAMKQAAALGMAGILIKNHYESTAGRAGLLNGRNLSETKVYGGVVLNWPAGGLNPYAAESCLKLGGKMVWMPTRDAARSLEFGDMPGDFFKRPGISLFSENGAMRREVGEILEVVRKYGACVATGHISIEESVALCRMALSMNVRTVLTHPNWERTIVPLEIQKELASLGVFIEKVFANIKDGTVTEERMVYEIRELGAERCFITTDRGQASEDLLENSAADGNWSLTRLRRRKNGRHSERRKGKNCYGQQRDGHAF